LNLPRTLLFVLAFAVSAFIALYPYLDAGGFCGSPGCPDALQAPHTASHLPGVSAAAVLAVAPVAVGAFAGFLVRRDISEARPTEWFSSPDPHPPRLSF
jgi:hypothetical protein